MATMPKKQEAQEGKQFPRKTIQCASGPSDDEKGRAHANLVTSPEFAAYRIVGIMQPKDLADEIDAPGMLATLRDQAAAAQRGDLSHAEAMLINQASALQALFVRLSERAIDQSHVPNFESFMRMALRAQSQCRATLETLAAIKNPPTVYARQANVTTGPQQINNGTAAPSRAREIKSEQTQLLRGSHGEWMDSGTEGAAIPSYSTVEALGEIDRAEVRRG